MGRVVNTTLIISCHPPAHQRAMQALHAALAAASLDMPVTLLWLEEGAQQLRGTADAAFSKMLQQLELFDDITLLCAQTALPYTRHSRLPIKTITADALPELINRHHTVMVY